MEHGLGVRERHEAVTTMIAAHAAGAGAAERQILLGDVK
jgi:hypothetical protein